MAQTRKITVTVKRYLPGSDAQPYDQPYEVEIGEPNSVLGILDEIYQKQDPSLAYQASCRRGYCSICTLKVNGKAVKTCLEVANCDLVLEPPGRQDRVIKDLAIKW